MKLVPPSLPWSSYAPSSFWFMYFSCYEFMYFYCYDCILIVCLCMGTLTEVFPCVFRRRKANARVKPAKTEHGPHSSYFLFCSMYFCVVCIVCFVSFSVLFVCICVLYYCHRVATQLQLTNISNHIILWRMFRYPVCVHPLYVL
jgi:hypothetical protein